MLRFGLASLTSRAVGSAAIVAVSARTSSSTAGNGGKTSEGAAVPPKASVPAPGAGEAPTAQEPPQKAYAFRPEEVLQAVKSGDIAKMQTAASDLVQHKWKEEYTLPAACLLVFSILWYWVAWTRRSVRRKCAAAEATVRQEAQQTVEMVRNLTEKWGKDIAKSDAQMKAIIEKNSTLTADIDRMTTALRSCSIRPTPASVVSKTKAADTPKAATVVATETPSLPSDSTEIRSEAEGAAVKEESTSS